MIFSNMEKNSQLLNKTNETFGIIMVLHKNKDKYKLLWQFFQIGKISRYITLIPLTNSSYHHYWLVRTSITQSWLLWTFITKQWKKEVEYKKGEPLQENQNYTFLRSNI